MATGVNITTTYAGAFAGEYISAALLSANTLADNAITIKPNIKFETTIKKGVLSDLIKAQTCRSSPTGVITLTERKLKPKALQVDMEICKGDFRDDWEAEQMGFGAWDSLPPVFEQWLLMELLASVAGSIETMVWNGAVSTDTFQGFIPLLKADTDVVDVAGTATITAANVISEAKLVANAIPKNVWLKEDCLLYMSADVARLYIDALGGFAAVATSNAGLEDKGPMWSNMQTKNNLSVNGIPVYVANGMPNGYMIAAEKSNLWFGTGLLNENNYVAIKDMQESQLIEIVKFVMKFTSAVNYGIGKDIVLYTPS